MTIKLSDLDVPSRWYIDTEFNDDGRTIELISIALVSDLGHEYYAHSADYDPEACNPWVKEHVLPHVASIPRKPRHQIAAEVRMMLLGTTEQSAPPEIWADFAAYDWVALCQLYGPMVNLPKGFPFWCRDLRQLIEQRRFDPLTLPGNPGEHDALNDARWCREAYRRIMAPRSVGSAPAPHYPPGVR